MQNTRMHSYLIGCSSRLHPQYIEIITKLAELIEKEEVTMMSQANKFVDKYVLGDWEWLG